MTSYRRAGATAALLLLARGATAQQQVPTGLLVDLQHSPALGVRLAPTFTWIVPPCGEGPDQAQTQYMITVMAVPTGVVVWESGIVFSADSVSAPYGGPPLNSSTAYTWVVSTANSACKSPPSAPATFVTGAWAGFAPGAAFLSVGDARTTFAYFRRELAVPAGVVSAIAHVAGAVDDKLLCGWKLYVDDALINVGPGRGEAPVWGGDGRFRNLPTQTLDLTAALAGKASAVLALQTMHQSPAVIFQLTLRTAAGATTVVVSDASWSALNGDAHRGPGPSTGGGSSAGTGFVEHIDARAEPVGWRAVGFVPGAGWTPATAKPPSADQLANLHPRMQPPMQVVEVLNITRIWPVPTPPLPPWGPVACGVVPENNKLQLACPDGSPITTVAFASFGTPTGKCPTLTKGSCDAASSRAVVEAACLGKTACTIPASNDEFGGDPCFDTVKQLAVALTCPGGACVRAPSDQRLVIVGWNWRERGRPTRALLRTRRRSLAHTSQAPRRRPRTTRPSSRSSPRSFRAACVWRWSTASRARPCTSRAARR